MTDHLIERAQVAVLEAEQLRAEEAALAKAGDEHRVAVRLAILQVATGSS